MIPNVINAVGKFRGHPALVRDHEAGALAKRHWKVAVVAPRRTLDEIRGEVHTVAVAAIAEEIA